LKVIWLFPAGVLVGAALAWVYLTGFGPTAPGVASSKPPGRPARSPASGPVEASPPAVSAGGSDLHGFAVKPDLAVTYWSALAVADAIAGHADRFTADAIRVLKADGDYEDVQKMLVYLPKELRAGVMERLITDFPDQLWDRWHLADLYLLAGDQERAFLTLLAQLESGSENPEPEISRLVKIDPIRAGSALFTIAEKYDWTSSLLVFCAARLVNAKQPGLGRPFLLKALEIDAADEEAVELMSRIDPALAIDLALKAVMAAPEDGDAWSRLAELRREAGDLAGAFKAYRQAASVATDEDDRRDMMRGMILTDPMAALPLVRGLAESPDDETLGILGLAYLAAGQSEAAFGVYQRAHDFDPSDSEWLHRMVAIDPGRAALVFAERIENSPGTSNDELVGTYALSLERQGKLGEAYDSYLRAWRLDDDDWEWMRGLARTSPERAAELLLGKYQQNPEDGDVVGALADAYAGLGRTAEAVRLYEQAIEIGEDRHRWMAGLAAVEPARGLPMLRAAVDDDPEDDEMWGALGDAYYHLGRMEDAKQAYDRALELDPSDWEWSVQRARIR